MTTVPDLSSTKVDALVATFADVALRMEQADIDGRLALYKKLYQQKVAIQTELRARPGDQRIALLALYDHPSMEVRFLAAQATRSVAPVEARRALERISASSWPQAGSAGMSLHAWDSGVWEPD